MSTPKTASASVQAPQAPSASVPSAPKTVTNWAALTQAGLVPVQIKCQTYSPVHTHDSSCHTRIPMTLENIQRHLENCTSGGFQFYLKLSPGKPSKIWEELSAAGIEASDFRCEVCDKQFRFHPSSFTGCMKQHKGKSKRAYSAVRDEKETATGLFNLTLSYRASEFGVEDADEVE